MAIFHFSAQVASRSAGRSAVAMAAYRSGDRLEDDRTGEAKHYRRDTKPQTEIIAPVHSPEWVYDRNRLWNEVEKVEKRKDAQLCREINVALPKEFPYDLQTKMLRAYCQREFVERGMIADVAIHRDDANNPHAHVMLTMREITPEGFGKKVREWNDRELIATWREAWAKDVNRIFEKANRPERIDHRSFEAQGITDRLPTIHEGPTVREMEQRGKITDRGSINRAVKEHNAIVIDLASYRKEREAIRQELAAKPPVSEPAQLTAQDWNQLERRRNETVGEIERVQKQLQRFEQLQQIERERDMKQAELEKLKGQKGWFGQQKNKPQIEQLTRSIEQFNGLLQADQLPPLHKVEQTRGYLANLQGTFKAIDQALKSARYPTAQTDRVRHKEQAQQIQRKERADRGRGR